MFPLRLPHVDSAIPTPRKLLPHGVDYIMLNLGHSQCADNWLFEQIFKKNVVSLSSYAAQDLIL